MSLKNKSKTKIKEKIFLILFGLFVSILLLELILQGLSLAAYFKQRTSLYDKEADYRILALGESTTADAFNGQSTWPDELEKILNNNTKGIRFKVYNEGIPGTNSLVILSHLDENIEKYNPHFVVALMGINDGLISNVNIKKNYFPFKLKTLSLFTWLFQKDSEIILKKECKENTIPEIEKHIGETYLLIDNWQIEEALEKISILEKENNCNYYEEIGYLYLVLQANYKNKEDKVFLINKTIFWLEKALEYSNEPFMILTTLGESYSLLPEYDLSINKKEYYEKALNLYEEYTKTSSDDMLLEVLPQLLNVYKKLNKTDKEINNMVTQLRLGPSIKYVSSSNEQTKDSFNLINEKLKKKHIRLIAMQYPLLPIEDLKNSFNETDSVIFISNEKNFLEALNNNSFEELFVDRFAGKFGHSTLLGNKIIAKNVANTILKELNQTIN